MALLLVEKHATIPAPLYIDDYREGEDTVLISTRIPGQTLKDIFHRLSFAERQQLSQDLKEAIKQIRRIPHRRPFRVCNTLGLPLVDQRVGTCGPFRTLADFTKHIMPENVEEAEDPESMYEAAEVFARQHRTFFTHADLCSTNIIMSQGRLVGIVD
jgi:aminoglycoside phosphotransferase (APT) family kinase protein